MLERLTNTLSVLIGLALGLVISFFGLKFVLREGLKMVRSDAVASFQVVETRLQGMADMSLELQKRLAGLGWDKGTPVFRQVERDRSLLAGHAGLEEDVDWAEGLEGGLLRVPGLWSQAGERSRRVAGDFWWQDFGRRWKGQQSYLVQEEASARAAFGRYNRMVKAWPASWAARDYGLGATVRWAGREARRGLEGAKGTLLRVLRRPVSPTASAQAPVPPAMGKEFSELPTLDFHAKGPWPEEFFPQVQYQSAAAPIRRAAER